MMNRCALLFVAALSCALAVADDWQPIARQLPPPGIEISAAQRDQLQAGLDRLEKRIAESKEKSGKEAGPSDRDLLADVEIFAKAVALALRNTEFYRPQDVAVAEQHLDSAAQRLDEMAAGPGSWTTARGLVVRGYRSRIDDAVQPYGLVIPENLDQSRPVPLYVWLHGRNDKLTDLAFIHERQRQAGQIRPDGAIVLHPFGRSCLGWKSAAEIDVLEAVESVAQRYPIDRDRVVLMGFSMGGAGAWHVGAHYADRWAAVHAGAGFVDVARYTRLTPDKYPPAYEQALWGVYDVPKYVRNLFNLPVVAYSGELDKQKDAADFMAEAFKEQGHTLTHLIGPEMAHKYAETSLAEVMRQMQAAVAKGRDRRLPKISLQTRTLRYSRMHWVEALGLEEHWEDARIDAEYVQGNQLTVTTRNVTSLSLSPPVDPSSLVIDGQALELKPVHPLMLQRENNRWLVASKIPENAPPRKSPRLQGPIDDAFLEPFLVVVPGGLCRDPAIERWVKFELEHFHQRWQAVYRGSVRMKRDSEVNAEDIAQYHLIVWGDPQSNQLLGRIAEKLPVRWDDETLAIGPSKFDRRHHVPQLIYPNPLNPSRYVVVNSGPTHREAHDRTNSLQNPKLPDWALIDVTVAPSAELPGRVVAADFFDEQWQFRPPRRAKNQ